MRIKGSHTFAGLVLVAASLGVLAVPAGAQEQLVESLPPEVAQDSAAQAAGQCYAPTVNDLRDWGWWTPAGEAVVLRIKPADAVQTASGWVARFEVRWTSHLQDELVAHQATSLCGPIDLTMALFTKQGGIPYPKSKQDLVGTQTLDVSDTTQKYVFEVPFQVSSAGVPCASQADLVLGDASIFPDEFDPANDAVGPFVIAATQFDVAGSNGQFSACNPEPPPPPTPPVDPPVDVLPEVEMAPAVEAAPAELPRTGVDHSFIMGILGVVLIGLGILFVRTRAAVDQTVPR